MVYRFIFISDEVDDFYREIQINSSASFLDFSNAILKSVGYPDDQMTSFFICEDNWEKREEITREEMNTSSEVDNFVMADTPLDEFADHEGLVQLGSHILGDTALAHLELRTHDDNRAG